MGDVITGLHTSMKLVADFHDGTLWTVSYNANNGSGTMENTSVYDQRTLTLQGCDFSAPEGYVFDGWEVNGTKYQIGDKITITANTEVKALWKENTIPSTPDDQTSSDSSSIPDTPLPLDTPSNNEGGVNVVAIAGIVIGSILVVGVGGFAVYWFIIKKKSFKDLINAFTNVFKKNKKK